MKSEILHILRSQDGYVSGQELCERFGVSRTAVWKTINQLKEEGYEIEAVPNKGYHITACPDVVSAEEVKSLLETRWAGQNIAHFAAVDSTNNKAKRMAEEGAPHGTLVIADEQTGGRGRRGRSWNTIPGAAIAMTLVIRPELPPERASMVTLLMGMAVASGCRELLGLPVGIKWPNDAVLDGKKICGILTEMSMEMDAINYLVIGTGINVNMDEFPEEISQVATSLSIHAGHTVNRAEVICRCMKYFAHQLLPFWQLPKRTKQPGNNHTDKHRQSGAAQALGKPTTVFNLPNFLNQPQGFQQLLIRLALIFILCKTLAGHQLIHTDPQQLRQAGNNRQFRHIIAIFPTGNRFVSNAQAFSQLSLRPTLLLAQLRHKPADFNLIHYNL